MIMNIVSNSMTKAPPILIKIIITCQLRYLQTLNNIAAENNSTVIFPVPVDVISQLMGKVSSGGQSWNALGRRNVVADKNLSYLLKTILGSYW